MRFPDLVVFDRSEQPILLIEIKLHPVTAGVVPKILHQLKGTRLAYPDGSHIEFGMIVDPELIRLYDLGGESSNSVSTLNSPAVFDHYTTRFRRAQQAPLFLEKFMQGLVEAWIRDLIIHWKTQTPPGLELFAGTGLLARLEGGWIQGSEVPVDSDALC